MSKSNPPSAASVTQDAAGEEPALARAKALPREVVRSEAPAAVPARMVNEILYCERLFYLEWVQGEFEDNAFTVDGRTVHRRADRAGGRLPPKPAKTAKRTSTTCGEGDDGPDSPDPSARPYQARSLWLTSDRLGLTAKIDVVEGDDSGTVVPIEYKRGNAPDVPEGGYLPERAQLCAQVLLLREHGYDCAEAALYFAGSRNRVSIVIDDELEHVTLAAVARARELAEAGIIPPPLTDSPKCDGCSLISICLPDEVNLLRSAVLVHGQPTDLRLEAGKPIRRLHPARDDRLPLYVQHQGARIRVDGERLVVRTPEGETTEARIPATSHVGLMGNVQITTQAVRALLDRGVPVTFFTTGGFYLGRTVAHDSNNVELRIQQYRAADTPDTCLNLARGFVSTKIRNCRTLLRRNHDSPPARVLADLEQLATRAEQTEGLPELLGVEGSAARLYFSAFQGMLKDELGFDLEGRNRRPPRDPVNALLSLAYSLLTKDFALAIQHVGLDPQRGFFHQPRFGRPSLALDLMEEFRPLLADSAVISTINQAIVSQNDFVRHSTGVSLKPAARRRFILAYERRMDQLVTHQVFGYRISYRRVLEVQARLLARQLLGEIGAYPAFRTR